MLCQKDNASTSITGVDVVTTLREGAEEGGRDLETREDAKGVHPLTDILLQEMMTLFGLHFHLLRKMINDNM